MLLKTNSMAASLKSKLVDKHGIVPGQTVFDKYHPMFRNGSSLEYIFRERERNNFTTKPS